MGSMTYLLPAGLSAETCRNLERAFVAGGPDNMPWPTQVQLQNDRLTVNRTVDESGHLFAAWEIEGAGRLLGSTTTLMDRPPPYDLLLELARGKIHQLRCQATDWQVGGLEVPESLSQQIREACRAFGQTLGGPLPDQAARLAQAALVLGYRASEQLVHTYVDQVMRMRQQPGNGAGRRPLDATLGCRLGTTVPEGQAATAFQAAFNGACLNLAWNTIQPEEGTYSWDAHDAVVDWATARGLQVTAGPLIDFSGAHLPGWLWSGKRDLQGFLRLMCNFVEAAVERYGNRIRRWQLTAGANLGKVLSLGEDERLWLTVQLAESARQVDPGLDLVIGIAQPWGEYLALEECLHSPFGFADTLVRSHMNLAAIDLELIMGVTPRGSYCRDLLETSRLLDLYAILGVPLRVTLGYPSSNTPDRQADPELRVDGGYWRDGCTQAAQTEWAVTYAALALCKPYVQAVQWVHDSDAHPHQFPHCGLLDLHGRPKPTLQWLAELREMYL